MMCHTGAQPDIFQYRGGFVELGHSDKHFVKNTRNKGAIGKIFGLFFAKILIIKNLKFDTKIDKIRALSKIRALFPDFQNKAGEDSPTHSLAPCCAPTIV